MNLPRLLAALSLSSFLSLPAQSLAQTTPATKSAGLAKGVIAFEQDGKTYYATEAGPAFAAGQYLYEGKGAPLAELRADHHGGSFQRHDVPADPITWWGYECDAQGKLWEAHNEATGRHFHNVVVRYGGTGTYPVPGSYDRMQLSFDGQKVYLMGEREKVQ